MLLTAISGIVGGNQAYSSYMIDAKLSEHEAKQIPHIGIEESDKESKEHIETIEDDIGTIKDDVVDIKIAICSHPEFNCNPLN